MRSSDGLYWFCTSSEKGVSSLNSKYLSMGVFPSKLNVVLANYSNAAIQPIGPEGFRT